MEVEGSGKATAPTATTAVATIASSALPAGEYDITVKASTSGNAAGEVGNMGLYKGTGTGSPIAAPTPSGVSGAWAEETYHGVSLDGSTSLTVQAIANGTASIAYAAVISANKVQ